ncbi:MAG: hypothetical protein QXR45_12865, partial [Candidatus Bathyarchaeia archaeon]
KTGNGDGVARLWVNGILLASSTTEMMFNNAVLVRVGATWTDDKNFITYFDYAKINDTKSEGIHFLFKDSFESGDFSAWDYTAGEPEVVNTTSHHGAYCLKADAEFDYASKTGLAQSDTLYVRGYFKFSALPQNPGDNVIPLLLRRSDGAILAGFELINEDNIQKIRLIDMITWETSDYITTLNVDQWYCFEIKYYRHSINGELRLYIDGVERCTLLNRQFADRADIINVGWVWGAYTGIIHADCIAAADNYI